MYADTRLSFNMLCAQTRDILSQNVYQWFVQYKTRYRYDNDLIMICFLSVCISSIIALSRISFIWSKITSFKKVKVVSNCGRFRSNLTIEILQLYYCITRVSLFALYCILYGFHRKAHARASF